MHSRSGGWKHALVHELIEYWINFAYLTVFLAAFVWYRRLTIEAAVLAKVIMVGDILRLGRGLERKPLILPTLYNTVVFSIWVGLFSLLEATVRGLWHKQGLTSGFEEIASKGWYEVLAWAIVLFVAFVPFFALRELDRVLGEGRLRALFWRRLSP